LADRRQPYRPFFVFLNFLDAHDPYMLPRGAPHRFATYSPTLEEYQAVYELWKDLDKTRLPRSCITLARDSYDDCLAYIDEQLGLLFDELLRRGVLDQTLIIVTSDHGEGLGEHNLFDHGESLYRTEIRVPLVIVPPSGLNPPAVVGETVSLRDLPATIVDLVGQGKGTPFPGESLARFWRDSALDGAGSPRDRDPVISELMTPNPGRPNQGRSPAARGPLISLAEGNFVYIRNERDGSEQLFNERDDPHEIDNRAQFESMRPVLEKFRRRLDLFRRNSAFSRR
jgi:arylsulfatase A-like enzyme